MRPFSRSLPLSQVSSALTAVFSSCVHLVIVLYSGVSVIYVCCCIVGERIEVTLQIILILIVLPSLSIDLAFSNSIFMLDC